jgi:hypothetical protein
MTHFKNKALLDFYNHTPKHDINKNFKIKDVQDYVPKPTPINLPEPPPIKNIIPKPSPIIIPDAPQQNPIGKDEYISNGKVYHVPQPLKQTTNKYTSNGKVYSVPDNLDGYVKVGSAYPKSERNTKPSFSNLAPKVDQPGMTDSNYKRVPMEINHVLTLAEKALKGEPISDAEGLKRATDSDDSVYIYGDTLYISGTKGPIYGKEWRQNMEYIAKPIVKGLVQNNLDKVQAIGSFLAPEFIPEMAMARGFIEAGKFQEGKSNDETKIRVDLTDRYKQALTSMEANPQIKKVVGFSVGGMTALELKKNYQDLTGNVYGTPYYDALGKESIKDQLNKEREIRENTYGKSLLNQPAKYVDNKIQDAVEMALGLNDVKTMKETGINRFRQGGDILTSLDNSAITSVNATNLINPIKAHNYQEQASQNFTADPTNAFGKINADNSISLIQ